MFNLKYSSEYYKTCFSEYLIEKYENGFFDYGIDVGACGVNNPWHINHMGKNNPNCKLYGYEVDETFFNKIYTECKSLSNVTLYKKYFGREESLKQLVEREKIDINKKWYMSCDCEGDEKYMLTNKEDLEILKKCTHIAFEIHPRMSGITNEQFYKIFLENFNDTHKIIRTFYGGGGKGVLDNSAIILVMKDVYHTKLKNIVNYLVKHPHPTSKYHRITFIN